MILKTFAYAGGGGGGGRGEEVLPKRKVTRSDQMD